MKFLILTILFITIQTAYTQESLLINFSLQNSASKIKEVKKAVKLTSQEKQGKKLFSSKGCAVCHYIDKGLKSKPFPSKQDMATLSFKNFKKAITEGKSDSAMPKFKLTAKEIKLIYYYIKSFK